jgi:hypothetical protein
VGGHGARARPPRVEAVSELSQFRDPLG